MTKGKRAAFLPFVIASPDVIRGKQSGAAGKGPDCRVALSLDAWKGGNP